jgi:ABC-2 type transport system permease protein
LKKFLVICSGFFKYKNLLYELVIRDIKIRYRRSFLGLLWTVLNPILMMIVITIVFSNLFRFDIQNYPIYFFAGNILFSFMTESTTNCLFSITGSASLIKKVYIPKYLFPLSKAFACLVNLLFSFIAMMLVMAVTGVEFHLTMLFAPLVLFYVLLFSVGFGMILSTIMVFFRDIAHLYSVFTVAWMYLTPIFYPPSLLTGKADWAVAINPMYYFIDYMRDIVLYNQVPTLQQNIICLLIGLVMLILGIIFFYRKQDKFILYI